MKKITKIGIIVMVLAMICSLAAGCSSNQQTEGEDKTFVIASDVAFRPFEYKDGDKYVGFDMDLMAAVAEDQGIKYQMDNVGFDAALQKVSSGQADAVIAGCSIKKERQETYDFSDPYYASGFIFAVKADSTLASVEELKGKVVAVKIGTMGKDYAESVKDQYGFTTKTFEDSTMMIDAVLSGQADAYIEDTAVIADTINSGKALKMIGEQVEVAPYGFAVLKGKNAELLQKFNTGLQNIMKNGKYDELLKKYSLPKYEGDLKAIEIK